MQTLFGTRRLLILGAVTGKVAPRPDAYLREIHGLRPDILRFSHSRRLPFEAASGDGDGMLL